MLKTLAKEYSVVMVEGPRQSGKTTLCKHIFPKKPYVLLEDADTRSYAINDPRGFLKQFPKGAILDEVQRAPELVSYLQGIVDSQNKEKGLFILTGSQNLLLSGAIKQSLAGRAAVLRIMPFSIKELGSHGDKLTLDELLLTGFYPRIYDEAIDARRFYANYYRTYLERDVAELIHLRNTMLFEKFIRLCAGRIGQLMNLSSLGNEVGISSQTAHDWLTLLEKTYVIFRLPPYHNNFNKRLTKSHKLYFVDIGFASYLLGIENKTQMARDPLRGHLFENMVIADILKHRFNQGWDSNLAFFRDHNGNEIDLLFPSNDKKIAVEIKSSQTITENYFKSFQYLSKIAGSENFDNHLLYAGSKNQNRTNVKVSNFKTYLKSIS